MHRRFVHLLAFAAIGLALWPAKARAGKYDLDLTPLGSPNASGQLQQDNAGFRSLSSELGTIIAPKPVDPADSLGLSGFAISADFSLNTLSGTEDFWRQTSNGAADNVAPSLQIMGRKGLWPGLEIGAGATHLFDSKVWALAGYGKFAFHEGFHHLPIPSIAIRGSFARVLGAKDFNMTTLAPAVTVSHVFGLGKTFSLTPYVGYEALLILSRSQVLDATPNCDEFPDAYNEECPGIDPSQSSEFVFRDAGIILRHRPHFGARVLFSVMRVTFEAMFVPGGNSSGTISGETITDGSGLQQQYTLSVGADF